MAEIIKNPELRYTADNQMAVTDMFVQFAPPLGGRPDEQQHPTIEVVGWGNLATEIKENYKQGDKVTIEGRLEMNTIERDGYKEKRARLVASRIYHMSAMDAPAPAATSKPPTSAASASKTMSNTPPSSTQTAEIPNFDADDVPF